MHSFTAFGLLVLLIVNGANACRLRGTTLGTLRLCSTNNASLVEMTDAEFGSGARLPAGFVLPGTPPFDCACARRTLVVEWVRLCPVQAPPAPAALPVTAPSLWLHLARGGVTADEHYYDCACAPLPASFPPPPPPAEPGACSPLLNATVTGNATVVGTYAMVPLAAGRLRALSNSGNMQIYAGVTDLLIGGNRTAQSYTYVYSGTLLTLRVTYNAGGTGTVTTTINGTSAAYANANARLVSNNAPYAMNASDTARLQVLCSESAPRTISLHAFELDGVPLVSAAALPIVIACPAAVQSYWLTQFTANATARELTVYFSFAGGSFSAGGDSNFLEVDWGVNSACLPTEPPPPPAPSPDAPCAVGPERVEAVTAILLSLTLCFGAATLLLLVILAGGHS